MLQIEAGDGVIPLRIWRSVTNSDRGFPLAVTEEARIDFSWEELDALKRVAQAQLEIEAKRREG